MNRARLASVPADPSNVAPPTRPPPRLLSLETAASDLGVCANTCGPCRVAVKGRSVVARQRSAIPNIGTSHSRCWS